ncbi:hypothetical protein [Tsukamurella spumae]|uniref:Uncharacterized protein n=1 Tax=Tsukamurella spumae TaxID=44753 RepID=A0A846WXB4_9ACTN|nr:hypothetical protein [Tsukamurella spumae]NKY17541.1 hypothetical protein [Tsukamurella spumae]
MSPSDPVVDRARVAAAYCRIQQRGKDSFDCARFRELYRHFFSRELTEDELDHQLLGYACADAPTLIDYVRHLEYHLLRHERRHRPRTSF